MKIYLEKPNKAIVEIDINDNSVDIIGDIKKELYRKEGTLVKQQNIYIKDVLYTKAKDIKHNSLIKQELENNHYRVSLRVATLERLALLEAIRSLRLPSSRVRGFCDYPDCPMFMPNFSDQLKKHYREELEKIQKSSFYIRNSDSFSFALCTLFGAGIAAGIGIFNIQMAHIFLSFKCY